MKHSCNSTQTTTFFLAVFVQKYIIYWTLKKHSLLYPEQPSCFYLCFEVNNGRALHAYMTKAAAARLSDSLSENFSKKPAGLFDRLCEEIPDPAEYHERLY